MIVGNEKDKIVKNHLLLSSALVATFIAFIASYNVPTLEIC